MLLHHIKKYLRLHSLQERRAGITVCWPKVTSPQIEEEAYCLWFCRAFSRKNCLKTDSAVDWHDYHPHTELSRLVAQCPSDQICLVTNPKLLITESILHRMASVLEHGYAACGPVYNWTDYWGQKAELPVPYLNIRSYLEVIELMQENQKPDPRTVRELDPGCALFDRHFLKNLFNKNQPVEIAVQAGIQSQHALAVEPWSLIHNFGDYFTGERDDLIQLVPTECKRILDIGCAAGMYGKKLRRHMPEVHLTGVELNPEMAALAQEHYDRVVIEPVQDIEFSAGFDLINCGDVLEHLKDPWAVLSKLRTLLTDHGCLVLSVPNVGHWTVVQDLLLGRFEYVPWGILCITHLRWFTEESIRQALDQAGFVIELFERQQVEPTPQGQEFVRTMVEQGLGNEKSLLSNEFLIRAYKR
jgi:2-polyprenyl-3-methyl-5-hydroxy-6-metoxy-1,4-benzoquinol methylase